MKQSLEIRWPDHYEPRSCPIHVRNELDMEAAQDAAWAWLTRASLWPTWYANSANVRIEHGGTDLKLGARFDWKTFGVSIHSTVIEFVPNERIGWDAHGLGVDAYHAWVLQPIAGGCRVVTEETQHGWAARLGMLLMPNRMSKFHQIWLEGLETKARSGLPPAA